jgi:sulfur-oxidizing protein SoxX
MLVFVSCFQQPTTTYYISEEQRMRLSANIIKTSASAVALLGCLGLFTPLAVSAEGSADITKGKALAFNKKKGNCLACHQIAGGKLAGNVGPPLVAMKARFPDFEKLKAQISDASKNNPNTIMPPFGPHSILSSGDIDKVAKFVHTL